VLAVRLPVVRLAPEPVPDPGLAGGLARRDTGDLMGFEIVLTAAVGLVVARAAFGKGRLRQNLAVMAQYRLRHVLAALLVGTVVAATAVGLRAASPVFGFNPILWVIAKVFHAGNGEGRGNLILSGLNWKWYAVVFLPVLALALPRLAQAEEVQYRARTKNWPDGVFRSVRFGLAHLIMLIPLSASLALTWAGLLFTWAYFRGGVAESTRYHAAFNTVIIAVIFALLLITWLQGEVPPADRPGIQPRVGELERPRSVVDLAVLTEPDPPASQGA
jgi:hypothetical protein